MEAEQKHLRKQKLKTEAESQINKEAETVA